MSFARTAAALGGLLVIQAGAMAWTWRAPPSANMAAHRLFALDPTRVDAVLIVPRSDTPPTPPPVLLEKHDNLWTIASADGYPTDGPKLSDLLRRLVEANVRAPIATGAASHAALRVGPDSYDRKVEIRAGQDAVTAFLGTTTAGTVNARLDGADEVFSVRDLTVFDLGPEARNFAAPAVVNLDTERALSVTVKNPAGTFTLRRDGATWLADVPVDSKKAEAFVRRATRLRLVVPVGRAREPRYGLDGSTRVTWTLLDGTSGGYTAGGIDGTEAWVQLDDSPFVVRVPMLPIASVRQAVIGDLAP